MRRPLRWTEQALAQLGAIAEYIAATSPVYAEQVVDRIVHRLTQAQEFPESGRVVPEYGHADIREVIEFPYRVIYRSPGTRSRSSRFSTVGEIWEFVARAVPLVAG